ncbi:hypothetical protein KUCAC02_000674 [Chaenocephalus aceratus]|uniref:Uncharacterized protein n=1 Tax=Chaenocephalus aceratus TaxID=36190 RepID=A0ACB9W7H4_CHAAC|nr:hypothetical protein KUCAC02_000674 [Chaenocephalus aceratus]
MGQLASKGDGLDLGGVPRVRFSTNEDGPPRYSPNQFDGSSQQRNDSLQIPPTIVVSDTDPSASEQRGSRAELRRSSLYSTLDLVPHLENYASTLPHRLSRPSLVALRSAFEEVQAGIWMELGVMIRCMLNIWGVILFLRLSWITSQAGILLTWVIILMSVLVTTVTALSISAIATNGRVISEVVRDLLLEFDVVIVDAINDVRIVGVITLTILLLISFAGMEWESKAQILFFLVLLVSFANYFVGTFIPPGPEKQAQGFFSYHSDIFISNLTPDWRGPEGNFFQMFAIFFPSTIGILSGANISGDLEDPATAIPKGTLAVLVLGCNMGWNFTDCIESQSCKYGLANNLQVLSQVSGFFYLITAGVFAASLSSALGFLVSGPKVFQCLCKDNLYPYIGFFAKGYGKNNEPIRAYLLCYVIAVAFILIADLNTIAALISNFFLCSYGPHQLSAAFTLRSPTPLVGGLISIVLMFLFTWWAALFTFCIIFFLFGYVNYNKPKVNWGSSVQAGTYNMALSYSVSLSGVDDHVKNFRPQCLVLTGPPNQRPALVDFVGSFTKHISLMICGDIEQDRQAQPQDTTDWLVKWLNKRKVRSFYTPFTADSLRVGARHLLQASGLGKLKPNTLVLGFKANWRDSSPESIEDYINTIYDTFDSNYCLCILRMMDALDISDLFDVEVNQGFEPDESVEIDNQQSPEKESADNISYKDDNDQIKTVFQNDQGKKTIDVYWIADDGGLTLLVPYLLTRRKRWHRSKVRVFIVGDEQNMEEGRNEMIALLKRFRLDIHDVTVMTDSEKRPNSKNLSRFVDSVAPFMLHDEQQEEKEFEAFKLKTERKVRLNEIIRRNSQHAALVLVSLPVPHSDCPSALTSSLFYCQ